MADLSFEWQGLWPLLIVVPGLAMWLYLRMANADRAQMFHLLGPRAERLAQRPMMKFTWVSPQVWLQGIAWGLVIAALMQPQFGAQSASSISAEPGRSLMLALDVSQSMQATDIRPSRLDRAKAEIAACLTNEGEPGARVTQVGLILFAGAAQWMMPLSDDRAAVLELLGLADPLMISEAGSKPAAALQLLADAELAPSILVVVTDADALSERALKLGAEVGQAGTAIFGLSIGTRQGARVPVGRSSKRAVQYLKDASGSEVLAIPDADALSRLCQAGGGKALAIENVQPPAEFTAMARLLTTAAPSLPQVNSDSVRERGPSELYQWPLAASLMIFLGLGLWQRVRRINPGLVSCLLILVLALGACDAPAKSTDASELQRLSAQLEAIELEAKAAAQLFQRHALLALESNELVAAEISAERFVARSGATSSARAWRDFLYGLCAWKRTEQAVAVARLPKSRSEAWNPALANVAVCIRYWRSASELPTQELPAVRNLERALLKQAELEKLKSEAAKKEEQNKPKPPKPPKPKTSAKPPPQRKPNQPRPQARGMRPDLRSLSKAQVGRILGILDQKLEEQRALRARERRKAAAPGGRGW